MSLESMELEELLALRRSSLLGPCPAALLTEIILSPLSGHEVFPAGAVVYDPDHFRRCLGVVLSGELQVSKGGLSVSSLTSGDLFGAAALYSDAPEFATTITAHRESRCLLLPQELVDKLIARDAGFRERYLRYLTGRIHFLSARMDSLAQHSVESKLARYLLSNMTAEHTLTCAASELAKRLGLSRSSLYRAFDLLESSGLITRLGKTISIPDPASLEGVCG